MVYYLVNVKMYKIYTCHIRKTEVRCSLTGLVFKGQAPKGQFC